MHFQDSPVKSVKLICSSDHRTTIEYLTHQNGTPAAPQSNGNQLSLYRFKENGKTTDMYHITCKYSVDDKLTVLIVKGRWYYANRFNDEVYPFPCDEVRSQPAQNC